jgi:hypothetical protein
MFTKNPSSTVAPGGAVLALEDFGMKLSNQEGEEHSMTTYKPLVFLAPRVYHLAYLLISHA